MEDLLVFLAVAGGFAAILGAVAWLGTRIRRRGIGGGLMGPIDEIYNPGAHRARLDVQTHEERVAPMPSPDDRWSRVRARHPKPGDGPTTGDPPPLDAG
ncbi:hypothetical protein [Phytohabitans rumicis]|uniref:Secreted protein n=1 Tax=Phytohabitans rumicis TaxID=1076125 RepID=A0A6V8LNK6_9ACTN|nr:hypothetical protein [Phytohabitans rumicis]GFJ96239.1 hypothetical protein Prum_098810 [Phytohabitans rumicis]